jgi:N-acetylglutamate synthase/N-acetylornithine aminotransferase
MARLVQPVHGVLPDERAAAATGAPMVLHEMATELSAAGNQASHSGVRLAMLDPNLLYASPSDVLVDCSLSRDDKVALLRQWKEDLELRSAARNEGMHDSEEGLGRAIATLASALERLQRH